MRNAVADLGQVCDHATRAIGFLRTALPHTINCGRQLSEPTEESGHFPDVFIG
jgi:hypothetical protein